MSYPVIVAAGGASVSLFEQKFQQVRIVGRRDHAPGLWSIRVQPSERLKFFAGQYTTLAVARGSARVKRDYSIVSSPLEADLEFFFELAPHGILTRALHKLKVGDSFWMARKARGTLTLDGRSGRRKHFMVATVTGVAPYMSIVRTMVHQAMQGRNEFVILHGASRSREFGYREELEALEQDGPRIRYIPTVSRPWEDARWRGEVGRAEDVARKYLDLYGLDPSNTTAYVCGHPQMIKNVKDILLRRGFSRDSIREEAYWPPMKS